MGYVDRNLVAGEDVLLRPRYHPVRFLPGALGVFLGLPIALAAFVVPGGTASPGTLLAVGAAVSALGLLAIALRAAVDSVDEFAITSLRVIKKTGFLKRRVTQIPVDKVQDLHVAASLWGRWLSYGTVEIASAAEDGPVVFPRIRNPEAIRNVVLTRRAAPAATPAAQAAARLPTAEERLGDVERLYKSGFLSESEHATKRQELIKAL